MARLLPERPALLDAIVETVRYKPERRYVCRLSSEGDAAVALKFFRRRDYTSAKDNASKLKPRQLLDLAEWIGSSDRHHVAALRWVPGQLLRDVVRETASDLSSVVRTGHALAEFHAQDVSLYRRDNAHVIAELRASAETLESLLPNRAARISRFVDRLSSRLASTQPGDATIHGDFYEKQVMLDSDRVVILDLDTAARGNPLVDLGVFVAHLERDALLGSLDTTRAAEAREALIEGYWREARSKAPVGMRLHTAVALLRLSSYPFRARHPEWPEMVERILDRAEAMEAG
jgi:tRNA A-37 threonylcarbamoyl transferase component Bud32